MGSESKKVEVICVQCPYETTCLWYGPEKLLGPHYKEKHPNNLIEGGAVLPFQKSSVVKQHLFVFEGKNFLLNTNQKYSHHSYLDIVDCSISVQFIGSQRCADDFEYTVALQLQDVLVKKFPRAKISSNFTDTKHCTEIHCHTDSGYDTFYFGNRLQISPQYHINIHHNQQKYPPLQSDRTILRDLECICCLAVMQRPINQCENGHLFCGPCKLKLTACPICKSQGNFTRNLFAESVIEQLSASCTYSAYGCKRVGPVADLESHEGNCTFGVFLCSINVSECTWKGSVKDVMGHVKANHGDHVLSDSQCLQVVVPCEDRELMKNDDDCFVFKCKGNVFRLLCRYEDCIFYWAVQLLGPSTDYDLFKYVLTVVSPNEEICDFKMYRPCLPYTEAKLVNHWLSFHHAFHMLDANMNLTYKIKIIKK